MKLTKKDIDKVRHIEGFPIAKDEDIIALSNPPYYTACPNPFIEDFMKDNYKPYDEETDDYHREPFAADISEGKYDPLYKLHSYPTKVPHKAIMRYILHYTDPGDIVFDGFCGTGMTGVATQSCDNYDTDFKYKIESEMKDVKWGARKALLSDLSPTATFISYNYNAPIDVVNFEKEAKKILKDCNEKYGWMYETKHLPENNSSNIQTELYDNIERMGRINYTVWTKVCICPNCSCEVKVWDTNVKYDFVKAIGSLIKEPKCKHCGLDIKTSNCDTVVQLKMDASNTKTEEIVKYEPVLINYTFGGKRYEKKPDNYDFELIEKIERTNISNWFPSNLMMGKGEKWGDYWRAGYHKGITSVNHFYTQRSLCIYAYLFNEAKKLPENLTNNVIFLLTSCFNRTTKMVRYMAQHKEKNVGPLSGTLYFSPIYGEINVIDNVKDKITKFVNAFTASNKNKYKSDNTLVSTQSTTDIDIPANSVDYIFIDPPFGDNLTYSELNFLTDSWLKICENNKTEAIVNSTQSKSVIEYQHLISESLKQMYKCLKPNRWMTVEFHNSKNAVWNAIQEAIQTAGFIIADVRTLDKKKGTTKQLTYTTSVKQDLVISAYKPKESFKQHFIAHAGSEQTVWEFIRQHLEKLPVVVVKKEKIELIAERQAFLLFDRMVAYHIINGNSVPLDASDFYKGLLEKFLQRDGMYFLHDQINEYDTARITTDIESIQMELFVSDEKTAISWLYQQLITAQTYAEIQPKFMQEIRSIEKYEKMPELSILLQDNFLQSDNGKWYIPDISKAIDVIKLREKKLIKEFEEYLLSIGKLKLFRTEAIRAGFAKLWKEKNYALIVKTAERLPDKVIQEDDKLLMYYDISLSRR